MLVTTEELEAFLKKENKLVNAMEGDGDEPPSV